MCCGLLSFKTGANATGQVPQVPQLSRVSTRPKDKGRKFGMQGLVFEVWAKVFDLTSSMAVWPE